MGPMERAISEADREAVLKASAMIDLADEIEARINHDLPEGATAALRFTVREWRLIDSALRAAAE